MKRISFLLALMFSSLCFSQNTLKPENHPDSDYNKITFDKVKISIKEPSKDLIKISRKYGLVPIYPNQIPNGYLQGAKFSLNTNYTKKLHRVDTITESHPLYKIRQREWKIRDSIDRENVRIKEKKRRDSLIKIGKWKWSNPQVLDGVYVQEHRFLNPVYHYEYPDTTILIHPFAIKPIPVTNKEYREFIVWVRDSIVREMLFARCEDDKLRREMLDLNNLEFGVRKGKWIRDTDFGNTGENIFIDDSFVRQKFNLNWDYQIDYFEEWVDKLIRDIYYPYSPRFYRVRHFNVDKFKYVYTINDSEVTTMIYPDTLGFVRMNNKNGIMDPFTNMYCWHPAFDDYPVVNVSYDQIQAFLHWKECMINNDLSSDEYKAKLLLPSMMEIESVLVNNEKQLRNNFLPMDNIISGSESEEIILPEDPGFFCYMEKYDIKKKELQFFGWNVSEFSRSQPGELMELITDKKWNNDSRIIYGTNWVLRTKKFQGEYCTDAIETTDVIEGTTISKPYLGFRYVLRLVKK